MTAPKRKCCGMAAKDVNAGIERAGQWFTFEGTPTTQYTNYLIAEAHLRYCAANDKTEGE